MWAMACTTDSGAPSSKSDRLTKICPSRSRIVVFSEVKRRKRTAIGGKGARGRSMRYSCWKIGTKSGGTVNSRLQYDRLERTAFQPSGFPGGQREDVHCPRASASPAWARPPQTEIWI